MDLELLFALIGAAFVAALIVTIIVAIAYVTFWGPE
jgi:hypothetical protein